MKFCVRASGLAVASMIALAMSAQADYPLEQQEVRQDFRRPADNAALANWRDGREWHYDTRYLFGVTRGLRDAGVPSWRPALWLFTIPFDLVNLPVAAAAGLSGTE